MKKVAYALLISGIVFSACGGGGETSNKEGKPEKKMMLNDGPEEEARPADLPEVAELVIEGNDQMQFNTKALEVWNGQKVKLTLKHVGEMPLEAMGHNWVLLKDGVSKSEFAEASIGAKDNGYIAADRMNDVIAYTETIGGGQETTIEFDAPAKGSYTYICTFPGHYGMMSGVLTVK